MAKRGPINSLFREVYRDALKMSKSEGGIKKALSKTAPVRFSKNTFYSFGIPKLAEQLNEYIANGVISPTLGKLVSYKAFEFASAAQLDAIRQHPEITEKVIRNPKIPFEKHIKPTEGLIGMRIMIKDPLKPATVQLIMTYNGITIKVTERKK